MGGLYSDVFNRAKIYNLLFFNIKTITEKPSFEYLPDGERILWERLSRKQYPKENLIDTYRRNAVYYPEFSKIIGLSYGYVSVGDDGNLKRDLKQVININENTVIETFFDILNQADALSKNSSTSGIQPKNILCGHNILDYDIPIILKRFMVNKLKYNNFNNKDIFIPEQLKKVLDNKPWDNSAVIDTSNVWRFGGYGGKVPLESIVEILNLKRNVVMLPAEELSDYYWKNIEIDPQQTLKNIGLQAVNTVNCVIQLMNELRRL